VTELTQKREKDISIFVSIERSNGINSGTGGADGGNVSIPAATATLARILLSKSSNFFATNL
jgi:hypothetical protein